MSAPDFTHELRRAIIACTAAIVEARHASGLTGKASLPSSGAIIREHGFDPLYFGWVLVPELKLIQTAERAL